MQDHLVDEPGRQGRCRDAAAHQGDVLIAGSVPRNRDRVLDPRCYQRLTVAHTRDRPMTEHEQRRRRVWCPPWIHPESS
jgi:hypothetical protein